MLFTTLLCTALLGVYESEASTINFGKSCSLTLQTDTNPGYEPVILGVTSHFLRKDTYNFVWPKSVDEQGVLTVKNNKKLLLACPMAAEGNYQVTSGNEEAYAICKNGKLTINGTEVTNTTTSCKKSYAYSWLNVTEETCGSSGENEGIIVQLGFQLEDGSYYPLAYSCFVVNRATTLWSRHQLMGASIDGRVRCSQSRSFAKGPSSLYPVVDPASQYPKAAQEKAFDKILGAGGAAMYISNADFLNRGHLAPHADFIFNTQRLMTYYYVNCAPQWYNFNGGNWLEVETFTRDLAQEVGITVNVWTGTYGILSLPNTSGVETKIYLDPDNELLPVPLVYWKLVQNPKTKACTVAIGHNNPFLKSAPDSLCTMVEPSGWPTLTGNFTYGYTYYCAYDTFKKVVDYVPDIKCKGLFEFSS